MKKHDSALATKSDVKRLLVPLESQVQDLQGAFLALQKYLDKKHEETRRHFDVVAEDIRHDLLGANKDEIEGLKQSRTDHGQRIARLERHSFGVAAR